jgi:hypothetical protein
MVLGERLLEIWGNAHFDITTDVADGPKPRTANFRGASKCCSQSIIRHETREPWKPSNSIKKESKIRSYLVNESEFKSINERVDIHYTFVAKSDL